jgi:exonuclease III
MSGKTVFADFMKMRGMNIIHQNIRGLLHNFGDLSVVLEKYKHIDIITLSETHITHNDNEQLFAIPGYSFVSKPRMNGTGGGVAVYISNNIDWRRRVDLESDNLEILCIEIIVKNAKNFLVSTAYRPPDSSNYHVDNFKDLFEYFLITANEAFKEVILLGDLNANYLDNKNSKELKSILLLNNYKQLIDSPTRITKDTSSLIDVILTTHSKNIASIVTAPLSLSDHDLVGCIRKINNQKSKPRTIKCRNYSRYNPDNLRRDLSGNIMEPLYDINNVNKAWAFLRSILTYLFEQHAPTITKRVKGSFSPWLNQKIKELMNQHDKILRTFRKTKSQTDWKTYKKLRNTCTAEIRKAKSQYHQSLLTESRNNLRKCWQTLKSIFPGKKKKVSVPAKSDLNKADSFCRYFSSIAKTLKEKTYPLRQFVWKPPFSIENRAQTTFQFGYVSTIFVERELRKLKRHKSTGIDNLPPGMLNDVGHEIARPISYIINLSLRSGQIPTEWKTAQVIPLHKAGNTTDHNNFRPISILPVISKIMERAVHHQLMDYLERNQLLSPNQFGYRNQRSTELATVLLTDTIRKAVDNGHVTVAVFLDLSKAFDTLGHDVLLEKLKSYGVKGLAFNWFADYLFQRSQVVKLGQELSAPCSLVCGIPQGSILGPILFLLFFNDFEKCLSHSQLLQFADDTVIYVSSKCVVDIEAKLNTDMMAISAYLKTNDLITNLNKGKTESILFGTSKRISTVPPQSKDLKVFYNDILINCTTSYTYLGTVLDQHLGFQINFERKYKRASSKLGILQKLHVRCIQVSLFQHLDISVLFIWT